MASLVSQLDSPWHRLAPWPVVQDQALRAIAANLVQLRALAPREGLVMPGDLSGPEVAMRRLYADARSILRSNASLLTGATR